MRRGRVVPALLVVLTAATGGAALAVGCSAVGEGSEFTSTTGTTDTGGGGPGAGGSGGEAGGGIIIEPPQDGGTDAPPDVYINPCGSECGPTELCDPDHLGLDDDCDGEVDEDCSCIGGQAHFCFKGDPSFRGQPGCFDGSQSCTENGDWGPCVGGVHATEQCAEQSTVGCHPIQAVPFQNVDLKPGTGTFSSNAVTETWSVACPAGVNPCPVPSGASPADDYKPLQSGEYTVTYTKTVSGGPSESCTYPLFVGSRGLRVELEWRNDSAPYGADIDLHLHQPNNTQPWAVSGAPQDCGYGNCTLSSLSDSDAPHWFPTTGSPPDPVAWYEDPVLEQNTCYYAPRGVGTAWQARGEGCYNPRLDLDNISCTPSVTDPSASNFCAPENINVDFPPQDQWFRIGVHYFSGSQNIRPRLKVYCNGALAADLGPSGFYDPEMPLIFPASGGGSLYWLAADVRFQTNECSNTCDVRPLYMDAVSRQPYLTNRSTVESNFGPPYPSP
ncbi:hypothetical protein [Chondromyces apiculatus]|uniref:Lipoprotein n=1 Tax=Chondromyces apiculatus DSM 436 TaxID=1192034 RepID=A0A017T735_9BACT|nr:hypothetical protein [Chondromyces apiculatus]EYF04600.1 Hypothetical protein CAP_4276 [Chondromyces apiculatus DSM 436]